MAGNPRTLTPFDATEEGRRRASELGKRGAEARRRKREAQQLVTVEDASAGANLIDTLTSRYNRDNLAPSAAAAAQHLIAKLGNGDIPIKDGTDFANALRALVDVARLEEGQATSHTLHASMDAGAIVARIEQLRGELAPGDSNP
jgi:hypothetical protein